MGARWCGGGVFRLPASFRIVDSPNVINTIYVMASYTYGPLLGLFAFGLYTRWEIRDRFVPVVVIAAPW